MKPSPAPYALLDVLARDLPATLRARYTTHSFKGEFVAVLLPAEA